MNRTSILNALRRRLGSKIFNCFDLSYFQEILDEESLVTFSQYYPKIIRGICIDSSCAIPTYDPKTGITQYHRYKIPKLNPNDEYIDIETYYFSGDGWVNTFGSMYPNITQAAFNKVVSVMAMPLQSYTCSFESPYYALVYPYRTTHIDFTLSMQRKIRLEEIPNGMQEYFIRLFTLDCKAAIYNDNPAARESGTINGVDIGSAISDWGNTEGDRDSLLEMFSEDFQTNPERFDAIFAQQ